MSKQARPDSYASLETWGVLFSLTGFPCGFKRFARKVHLQAGQYRSQGHVAVFFGMFSPRFFWFCWWPNSLTPAAVVIFGRHVSKMPTLTGMRPLGSRSSKPSSLLDPPSYLRHVSKVPTLTGVRPLRVAILKTVVVLDPHIFVTTSRHPYPKKQETSPRPPYPENAGKVPGPQASISLKFRQDTRSPGLPILKIQDISQVPGPPYLENSGKIPNFPVLNREKTRSPSLLILKIQEGYQVPRPPYPVKSGRTSDPQAFFFILKIQERCQISKLLNPKRPLYPENSGKISGPQASLPGKSKKGPRSSGPLILKI